MEQKAFELIQEKLQAALNEQGFGEAVALETDNGRGVMFAAEKVAPKCENLAKNYKDSEPMKRMCTIFCDMYAAGDMDTRAVIQFGVLNNIKDEAAIRNIIANFTDGCDLQKVYKHSRKLIGKNIKSEKEKKKGKKVEARLSN